MNIVVLGSTGGIGREVVAQALAAGHHVTAVVRGTADPSVDERLQVVRADATDAESLRPHLTGTDVVVSALGRRRGDLGSIQGDAASALAAAAPVGTRALFVGASAMFSDAGDGAFIRWVAKPALRRILRASYADTARMEAVVERSGLRWTFVRPSRLTDGRHTGSYRTSVDLNLRHGAKVSRSDVADAMLRLMDEGCVGHAVYVAY